MPPFRALLSSNKRKDEFPRDSVETPFPNKDSYQSKKETFEPRIFIGKAVQPPKVLLVTPEITRLPESMSGQIGQIRAKAGGLADVSASLVNELHQRGVEVHVALPNYRRMFNVEIADLVNDELRHCKIKLPDDRIHLAEDCTFYYREQVYHEHDDLHVALAFQREVINHIIPRIQPDIIHCNDWMTGLIPPVARRLGIPSLFTVHNIHTKKVTLGEIEHRGIDPAEFWDHLYYDHQPNDYWQARDGNAVNMLTSGIFASHTMSVVSPTFLDEIVRGEHEVPPCVRNEIRAKQESGHAHGVLNAPDPSFDPQTDSCLVQNYGSHNLTEGKAANKRAFQKALALDLNLSAPLFLWPSRLDPMQKGCQLLTQILYQLVADYADEGLQVAVVADGPYQQFFFDIINHHGLAGRVGVCDFNDELSHLGYAASDYLFMPSLFEPCGLSQMIGCLYGTLPIVHDTGGLHDTISPLEVAHDTGNGFPFENFDAQGLRWATDQAMAFHRSESTTRTAQISRIMRESSERFNFRNNASHYLDIYEEILARPMLPNNQGRTHLSNEKTER